MTSVTALPRILYHLTHERAQLVQSQQDNAWRYTLLTESGALIDMVDADTVRDGIRANYIMNGPIDLEADRITFRVTLLGMSAAPLQCPPCYPQLARGDKRRVTP